MPVKRRIYWILLIMSQLVIAQLAWSPGFVRPAAAETPIVLSPSNTRLHAETGLLGRATGVSRVTGGFARILRPGLRAEMIGLASMRQDSVNTPSRRLEFQLQMEFNPTPDKRRLWLSVGGGRGLRAQKELSFAAVSAGTEFGLGPTVMWLQASTTRFTGFQASTLTNSPGGGVGDTLESPSQPISIGSSARSIQGSYADAELGMRWGWGRVELDGLVGLRLHSGESSDEGWTRLQGTVRLSNRLAFIGRVGIEPSMPEQDLPSRNMATLALRVNFQGGPARRSPPKYNPSPSIDSPTAGPTPAFWAVSLGNDLYQFRFHYPSAELVEIAGDFNDWRPSPMNPSTGGLWLLKTTAATGSCRISIRIDGGNWSAPPGLPAHKDEFGRTVSCLLIG